MPFPQINKPSDLSDLELMEVDIKTFNAWAKLLKLTGKACGMTVIEETEEDEYNDDGRTRMRDTGKSVEVKNAHGSTIGRITGTYMLDGGGLDTGTMDPCALVFEDELVRALATYLDANIPKECARCATMPPEGICEDCMKAMDMQLQIASVFNTRAVDVRPKNGDTVVSIGRTHTFANGFWEFSTGTAARYVASHQAELTLLWVADNFHCTRKAANNG